jgi:hypothetical protein
MLGILGLGGYSSRVIPAKAEIQNTYPYNYLTKVPSYGFQLSLKDDYRI